MGAPKGKSGEKLRIGVNGGRSSPPVGARMPAIWPLWLLIRAFAGGGPGAGFGRIGRLVARIVSERDDVEVLALPDCGSTQLIVQILGWSPSTAATPT